jgi:hypothetical protein
MVDRAEGQVVSLEPDSTAALEDLTTTIQELQKSIEDKNRSQAPIGKLYQTSTAGTTLMSAQNC